MSSRTRPTRRPIVPIWMRLTLAVVGVILVLGLAFVAFYMFSGNTVVPDVIGLHQGAAAVELAGSDLKIEIAEERFDALEEGTVLEQDPESGETAKTGSTIRVVVSAGTEEFPLPDVIGQGIRIARPRLEQAGLVVKVDTMSSDAPEDTVISTNPSPGSSVRTGEIVRLTIASEESATEALLPYSMSEQVYVVDPAPTPDDEEIPDVTMEVARRLQSLLEASGAKVIVTRSISTTATDAEDRATKVPESGVASIVGLSLSEEEISGFTISNLPKSADAASFDSSVLLAEKLELELRDAGLVVQRGTLDSDPVMEAASAASVRVALGDPSNDSDSADFRDPTWADTAARTIYRALGERFGK